MAEAIAILDGIKGKYEEHHRVKITTEAVEMAVPIVRVDILLKEKTTYKLCAPKLQQSGTMKKTHLLHH